MMSGAVWVRDRLQAAGWRVAVADARKVKAVAPLACKTDKVDARVLAELCRRDLVPAVWVPSFSDRELRERLNRRAHLIRLRTAAKNRVFGALSQRGPVRVRAAETLLRRWCQKARLARIKLRDSVSTSAVGPTRFRRPIACC
jgi:transposase